MLGERLDTMTRGKSHSHSGSNRNNNNLLLHDLLSVSRPTSTTKLSKSDMKIADDEFMAAAIGDMEWLRQSLRKKRIPVNFDKNGFASIHLASVHGRLECLRFLVEKLKHDVNMASSTGWRPVHLVISNQTGRRALNCLRYIISKGGDTSITNDDGVTPVHQAASEGHVQCLKLLIESGARVDAQDCREHMPIDLAKLWGHKQCGRILAAEMWHENKDFIAKEMRQLQRVKMQQVLKEIELEEERVADQHFYGEVAFENWLDIHELPPKPTGPPSVLHPIKKGLDAKSNGAKVPLMHPNSIQKKPMSKLTKSSKMIATEVVKNAESGGTAMPMGKQSVVVACPEKADDIVEEKEPANDTDMVTKHKEKLEKRKFINPIPWSKSPKVKPPEYVAILHDHYPRDEYTMLPKHPAVRKNKWGAVESPRLENLTGFNTRNQVADNEGPLRMPKLPADVIEKVLSKDADKDRDVVFKCKNILDIQKRVHFDPDRDPIQRSEIGFHLANQIDSHIFRSALQLQSVSSGSNSTHSGLSSQTSELSGMGQSGTDAPEEISLVKVMGTIHKTDYLDANTPSQKFAW